MQKQKEQTVAEERTAFFFAPVSGRAKYGKIYDEIIEELQSSGYKVLNSNDDFTPSELKNFTKEELRSYYIAYQRSIKDADIFVSESTISSASVGYEIRFALSNHKPTLVLRNETETTAGPPIAGNPSKLLTLVSYNDTNLKTKIKQFLKKAQKGIFVKRLPIEFTQNQVEYVEYRQRFDGKKRSFNATVRELIEAAREADVPFMKDVEEDF